MRRGFTLLEVLLASIILGLGLTAIIVSMTQAQQMMLSSTYLQTAQEVMDFGDMAYPLSDVQDPDNDLDVRETKATELWEKFAGEVKLTSEQYEKYRTYTWEREALNRDDEEEIKRLGDLYTVRVTVRWGDRRRGNGEEESYITFWRKPK
ncbi:MAG: prepilin-type N-terminal cleavage/methylation domain-containing protein [Kiritimatiellae bacterium]|nr:prepilin-type N-terminal cleavage/methylation domain-containing protein [Kiritimatiellia bacterium]